MTLADRPRVKDDYAATSRELDRPSGPRPTRRFVGLTVAFLLLFAATSPLYLESASVLAVASVIAGAAAGILGFVGVSAHAADNVLQTARGGFLVTQECVSTPLIPLYLAAVCSYSTTWRRLILWVAATVPLFVGLGIVRLLLVALPAAIVSPLWLVHAFYQLLLGVAVVIIAALWRHGSAEAVRPALVGLAVGVVAILLIGPAYSRSVNDLVGPTLDDPQGAIVFLPTFQVGLFVALWVAAGVSVGWTRMLAGLAILIVTQAAGLVALQALASGAGLTPHVRDVRGWAVAGPVLIFAVMSLSRARDANAVALPAWLRSSQP